MTKTTFQAIGRMLDAAAEVIGVPFWICDPDDATPARREACPHGVALPAAIAEPCLTTCRCGASVILAPVCALEGETEVSSVPFLADPTRKGPQDGHTVTFTVTLPRKAIYYGHQRH